MRRLLTSSSLLFVFLSCCGIPAIAASPAQQGILLLSADNYAQPHIANFAAALNNSLKQDLQDKFVLHMESLNLPLWNTQVERRHQEELLREKYRNSDIRAIVTIGNTAINYMLDSGQQIWPDIPVTYWAAQHHTLRQELLPPHFRGQTFGLSLIDTIRMAKSLLPGTKRLALIGNPPENDFYRPFYDEDLASLYEEAEFIDLRNLPIEEVRRRTAALPEHTMIYYTRLSEDGTGRRFAADDALESIARIANRPILVDNAALIGSGALGGLVIDPGHQGRITAYTVRAILQGNPPPAPTGNTVLQPQFDWRQVVRWNIPRARLPAQSELRFYQASIWERYRWQICAIAAALLLQFILLAALLVERKRRASAEQRSRQRLAELAHVNRTTTATVFSSSLAHELNQPLAAILSNAEAAELFLQMQPPALQDVREILADIRRDNHRASELLQRLRDLLKKTESTAQVIDMNDVVKHALKFMAPEARARKIVLTAQLASQALRISGDPVQLQQVLINLIVNSMDAMADGTRASRAVTVRTAAAHGACEVSVADTGPGFGASLDHVFDSFFTTKAHGMGLGLPIVAEIIQSHGGRITADNAATGGAVIRFTLPLHIAT